MLEVMSPAELLRRKKQEQVEGEQEKGPEETSGTHGEGGSDEEEQMQETTEVGMADIEINYAIGEESELWRDVFGVLKQEEKKEGYVE